MSARFRPIPGPVPTGGPAPEALPRAQWQQLLAFALLYVLVWSVLPPRLLSSLPFDVVESISWGREWQWGYYKHPPLAPWVLHLFYRAFGNMGPFLLSQLCIAATLGFVWLTGRRLLGPQRALLGTALTMGVAFYTRPALEFNHNVAQMPLWAGIGWAMLVALQEGRPRHWLLLGLLGGLGMLTKYSIGILLLCLGLYLLLGPQRARLRGAGPWLALAVLLAVLAPHLRWLWQSGWLPLTYMGERSATPGSSARLAALGFLTTQLLNHLPMLLVLLGAALGARRSLPAAGAALPGGPRGYALHTTWPGYLWCLALGPGLLLTLLGLALGLRIRDMWGMPMWAFSGLLVAAWLPGRWVAPLRTPVLRGTAAWLMLATVLSLGYLAFGAQLRHKPARTDWPQAALAAQAAATWDALSHCPLDVVAGNYWLAGLVAVPLAQRPSVLVTGDARFSPWVTPQRLLHGGALWLREDDEAPAPPAPLGDPTVLAALQEHRGQWQLPWPHDAQAPALTLHWRAYVPARCSRAAPAPSNF